MTQPSVPLDSRALESCESEPIHIPGSIQPHGVLLALDPDGLVLVRASQNADALFAGGLRQAFGKRLDVLLDGEALPLCKDIPAKVPETGTAHLRAVTIAGRDYNAIVHRSDDLFVLELEEAGAQEIGTLDSLYPRIRTFIDQLQATTSIAELNALAAEQIRALTGFDRVLIYRFDVDWNGTVIAEDRNDRLPSYMDLRFPASDIPAQARELYRLNRLRIIPDAAYEPVAILAGGDRDAQPLDLSFSVLRSVSPVHVEYMRNMETPASMSISIIDEGALWGLISCHSAAPRRVPIHVRTACDFLGQFVAMQLSARTRHLDSAERVERHGLQTKLLGFMASEDQYIHGLTRHHDELLELVNAQGAAVVLDGECTCIGEAPGEGQVADIVEWLSQTQSHDDVFSTRSLAQEFPAAEAFADKASGLLAISISQLHPSYLLWFRPEVVHTVKWGGDPRKPVGGNAGAPRLHPRKSFEMWKETVRLQADPWTPAEIDTAAGLRNAIIGIVMRKAEELAQLTDELRKSNKELEAFSYSVSHDLRAPFRHIVGYAELLKDTEALKNDSRSCRYIDTIIESALTAGQLVDGLLGFSQMGRAKLMPIEVDVNRLVDEVRRLLSTETAGRDIEWHVEELAPARGDPAMLRQVIQNLLSNAIKYTRTRDKAVIEVKSEKKDGETVYCVRDNGVGFEMTYVGKLFGVFQRLHRMEDFEGTGIGLANVRRIVERHGGRTWAEGKVDAGATFYFSLPHQTEEEAWRT